MLQFYMSLVQNDEEQNIIADLYEKHEQEMYKAAYAILHNSHSAEDAVHEAFIRVIHNLGSLTFTSDARTRVLLIVIVRNISIDMYRKAKKLTPAEELDELASDPLAEEEYRRLERSTVEELLKRLPEELKQVIALKFIEEMSTALIAEMLGMSVSGVNKRLRRAKAILREIIEEEIHE